jgi:PAS domain S-box-containing protein
MAKHATSGPASGILHIVVIYVTVAALWLLLSDQIMKRLIPDPALLTLANSFKDWLFVILTSFMLYGLLKGRERGRLSLQPDQPPQSRRFHQMKLLAAIADHSEDAIFAQDLQGRFVLFNRAAERISGKSAQEVLGRDESAVLSPELAHRHRTSNRQVIQSGTASVLEETLTFGGMERVFLTTKSPLADETGRVIGIFGISRDISARKAAETALRRQTEALQAHNEELERFNRATIGRELVMIELKRQINELSQALGREPPYPLTFLKEPVQEDLQGPL